MADLEAIQCKITKRAGLDTKSRPYTYTKQTKVSIAILTNMRFDEILSITQLIFFSSRYIPGTWYLIPGIYFLIFLYLYRYFEECIMLVCRRLHISPSRLRSYVGSMSLSVVLITWCKYCSVSGQDARSIWRSTDRSSPESTSRHPQSSCGVVRCGVVWCRVVRCGAVRCSVVRCGCGTVSCGGVRCGPVRCGMEPLLAIYLRTWYKSPGNEGTNVLIALITLVSIKYSIHISINSVMG